MAHRGQSKHRTSSSREGTRGGGRTNAVGSLRGPPGIGLAAVFVSVVAFSGLTCTPQPAAAREIVHDAEYYVLEAQYGEKVGSSRTWSWLPS